MCYYRIKLLLLLLQLPYLASLRIHSHREVIQLWNKGGLQQWDCVWPLACTHTQAGKHAAITQTPIPSQFTSSWIFFLERVTLWFSAISSSTLSLRASISFSIFLRLLRSSSICVWSSSDFRLASANCGVEQPGHINMLWWQTSRQFSSSNLLMQVRTHTHTHSSAYTTTNALHWNTTTTSNLNLSAFQPVLIRD